MNPYIFFLFTFLYFDFFNYKKIVNKKIACFRSLIKKDDKQYSFKGMTELAQREVTKLKKKYF